MENGIREHLWILERYFGSSKNEECKIDSIAQSWSVISRAGDQEKIKVAMESLEKYLVDKKVRNNKIVKSTF